MKSLQNDRDVFTLGVARFRLFYGELKLSSPLPHRITARWKQLSTLRSLLLLGCYTAQIGSYL
jgi:hypothetical protein